ncbi:hypothetical protein [Acerihabitans arboris]|uniref:Uncharacterized protein n=1 Tax=Acerihabitans arboris TaxID=2691583 RepID=A0A845STM9_9GAMM|nr:hypothetical protein [Acerihabitans arboris]NDL66098.1 hypothetical protein [Acerihabitans arboris]
MNFLDIKLGRIIIIIEVFINGHILFLRKGKATFLRENNQVEQFFLKLKLTILAATVFFVGVAEFILASMLPPLAVAFDTTTDKATLLISG